MSALSTVQGIKESLSKLIPAESVSDESSVEQCRDMIKQLDECDVTLEILTKTLVGTVVSKFKTHDELGSVVKSLLKKWKKIAKEGPQQTSASATSSSGGKAKKPAMERRSSTASDVAEDLEDEWTMLQPVRQNTCKKLHSYLLLAKKDLVADGINAKAVDHLTTTRATEVEASIHVHSKNDKQAYAGKARSLCFNIKQNQKLGAQIILGHISGSELVTMSSEELVSDAQRKEKEERTKKLMDTRRLDWDQANEGKINEMCGIKGDLLQASLFTCGRCKSVKTTSTQKQTRSADEPMTVFVLCLNCGKRWKC
jgi:transcription elongation factor S-II